MDQVFTPKPMAKRESLSMPRTRMQPSYALAAASCFGENTRLTSGQDAVPSIWYRERALNRQWCTRTGRLDDPRCCVHAVGLDHASGHRPGYAGFIRPWGRATLVARARGHGGLKSADPRCRIKSAHPEARASHRVHRGESTAMAGTMIKACGGAHSHRHDPRPDRIGSAR
jgi:hypothetical protein